MSTEYDDWDKEMIRDAPILIKMIQQHLEEERIRTAYRQCAKAGARLTEVRHGRKKSGMAQSKEGSDKGTSVTHLIDMEHRPI